jgi:hypothetical protein
MVTIEGNPMAHAKSYLARSTGNEVSQATGGGVITHQVKGAAYFQTFSMNVFVESQPAVRHLDLLTHNHTAMMPGNTPPAPWMSTMIAGPGPAPKESEKEANEGKHFITSALKHELGRPVAGLKVLIETAGKHTFRTPSPKNGDDIEKPRLDDLVQRGAISVHALDFVTPCPHVSIASVAIETPRFCQVRSTSQRSVRPRRELMLGYRPWPGEVACELPSVGDP